MKWWHYLLIVVALLVVWYFSTHNTLVRMRTKVEEAFSNIDVYLKKRFDLIPNLVNTVKGYAKHESQTLEAVIKARNLGVSANTPEEKMAANDELTSALNRLMVVVEQYPDLKADQGFRDLQAQLVDLEKDIANYRKFYNATVQQYNVKVESIPSNIVANIGGFQKATLYEIDEASQRQAPTVEF